MCHCLEFGIDNTIFVRKNKREKSFPFILYDSRGVCLCGSELLCFLTCEFIFWEGSTTLTDYIFTPKNVIYQKFTAQENVLFLLNNFNKSLTACWFHDREAELRHFLLLRQHPASPSASRLLYSATASLMSLSHPPLTFLVFIFLPVCPRLPLRFPNLYESIEQGFWQWREQISVVGGFLSLSISSWMLEAMYHLL